ncbi:MAG: response regulator, partial [bacterium]|nr:response regulator [bacterium]
KASRGEEGLNILKHAEEPILIVLLDLKMPGMDGMEVLRQVREMDKKILVIIMTGFATIETAIEAMKQGAYDFMPKPFEPDHVRIVVGRALEKLRLTWETEQLEKERRKTLLDLGTEKSRIRTIIESLPSGVVVTNAQGQVVLMNPSFLRQFDLNLEQASGDQIETYVNDTGFHNLVAEISQGKYRDSDEIPSYEIALANGRYLQARGRPVMSGGGECLGA